MRRRQVIRARETLGPEGARVRLVRRRVIVIDMIIPDNEDESRRTSVGSRVEPESKVNQDALAQRPRAGATAAFTKEEQLD